MILHGLIKINAHLKNRNIRLWIQMFQYRPGTMIETPFFRSFNFRCKRCNLLCIFRRTGSRILNLEQLIRKAAEIMNGFWLGKNIYKGTTSEPMRRHDKDGIDVM